ncbi:MAG: formate/nitrite transporter family protein [Balneolaceae bacterium]
MKNRFLDVKKVVGEMSRETTRNLRELTIPKAFVLSLLAGAFITFGALFSVFLSAEVETMGIALLLQGFGFSVGFFMVILTGSLLFTETNVVLPASLLNCDHKELMAGAARFWMIAILGNVIGAFLVGFLIMLAHHYPQEIIDTLAGIVDKKMAYAEEGTATSWFQVVLSGVFGNWLVGMAAVFAIMGKTIIGKYIPIWLAVSLFVAGNFQHSPANMGYFSLIMPLGIGPGWVDAVVWNLIPAAIGNILGGIFLVALPFWYALNESEKNEIHSEGKPGSDEQTPG